VTPAPHVRVAIRLEAVAVAASVTTRIGEEAKTLSRRKLGVQGSCFASLRRFQPVTSRTQAPEPDP
jgi:hypothetical protein